MAPARLSQAELDRRNIINVNAETVTNTSNNDFPGNFVGEDHAWDPEEFKRTLEIQFHYNRPYESSFSVVHIPAAVANAFRRILLATLPTIAIEQVFMYNNTSVIQDEVLAHRLGQVPLAIPPELLRRMRWRLPTPEGEKGSFNDNDTLTFKLQMACTHREGADKYEEDPLKLYNNAHIYARDLVWVPQGRQARWLGVENLEPEEIPEHLRPRPANPDILIGKMRPGQQVELEMYAVKGSGGDHAKFSPVATATYRLLPTITILKPIIGDDAFKFRDCFIPGVIELKKITPTESKKKGSGYEGKDGLEKAVVKDAFKDSVSRECLRHEEFQGKVKLGRVRDHFIFSIESTGQYESDVLFAQSIRALRAKCADIKKSLEGVVI